LEGFSTSAATSSAAVASQAADVPLALPDKLSIAVLLFQNMSGDPEQEYFTDDITEDNITELARMTSVLMIRLRAFDLAF
jgi:adenylate cyclase